MHLKLSRHLRGGPHGAPLSSRISERQGSRVGTARGGSCLQGDAQAGPPRKTVPAGRRAGKLGINGHVGGDG